MKTKTFIEPWLTLTGSTNAIEFFKKAFDAVEIFHLEDPDGNIVARLSIDDATFWISEGKANNETVPVRMVLNVEDPDMVFAKALSAGATEIFPVGEEHGWRLGRLADPFGHHWEIGKELSK